MTNKVKTLIIAILVLAALVGVFFVLRSCNKEDESGSASAGDSMIDLNSYENNQISEISYTNRYGSFSFICNAGIWSYKDDMSFPADQTTLNNIATSITAISAMRDITDEKGELKDYGLTEGALTLNVSYTDSTTHSFVIGDYNSNVSGTYLMMGDNVYISATGLGNTLDVPLFDMANTTEIAVISSDTITSVVLNGEEKTDPEWIKAFMSEYELVYKIGVEDYTNREKYGFPENANTVTLKYSLSYSNVLDDGSVVQGTKDNEYTLSFTVMGDMEYLMLPNDDLIYSASGLNELLNVEVTEDTNDTEAVE